MTGGRAGGTRRPAARDARGIAGERSRSRLPVLIAALGAYAVTAGAVTLAGWVLGVQRLTDWLGGGISMFFNTAAAAVAAGTALLLRAGRGSPRRAPDLLAACVAGIGAATLLQHLTGLDLGIDVNLPGRPWGLIAAAAPGRMGPPASTSYALLGAALWLLGRGRRARVVASALATGVVAIATVNLIGYAFGASGLYSLPRSTAIAFQTSTVLFALAAGVTLSVPEAGLVRFARDPGPAGVMVRRSIPFVVGLPLGLGWLRVKVGEAGLVDLAAGVAMLVVALVVLLCFVTWRGAKALRAQDVARRRAQRALAWREREQRRQREFLERLVASAPAAIAVVRGADLRVDAANPLCESVADATPVVGRAFADAFPHLAEIGEQIRGVVRTGETWHVRAVAAAAPGGAPRWWDGEVVALRDAAGAPDAALVVLWDVTARRELLERELRARADAENALRLKDEFLATLSHELRTPLHAIVGWAYLLRTQPGDPEVVRRSSEVIDRNAKAQAQLVSDLLDMSRIATGKMRLVPEPVQLGAVLAAAVDVVRPAADAKGVQVETEPAPGEVRVVGDPARLQQVAWNLLANAVKFTPRGGRVTARVAAAGGVAELRVRDTGDGVAPEFLPHLFERFRQADSSISRQHGGLGIGLALVKELVELHGGRVSAASAGRGEGATFVVELPLASDAAAAAAAGSAPRPESGVLLPRLAGLRVLVVDDERDALDLARAVLEARGAHVATAGGVDEALRVVESERVDVVVTDLGMPQRSGYDLLAEVRRRGLRVPAVACSAFASAEDRARTVAAGFQHHVAKPVDPTELVGVVAYLAAGGAR